MVKLLEVSKRNASAKIHLTYLKHLYNSIEIIDAVDQLPANRSFVSCSIGDLQITFLMLAEMLVLENLTAIKMYQTNSLIVAEVIKNV